MNFELEAIVREVWRVRESDKYRASVFLGDSFCVQHGVTMVTHDFSQIEKLKSVQQSTKRMLLNLQDQMFDAPTLVREFSWRRLHAFAKHALIP